MIRHAALLLTRAVFAVLLVPLASAQDRDPGAPVRIAPVVVTATRAAQSLEATSVKVDVFDAATLARSPALTVDEILKQSAAFSLFRRTGSLMAHPTAQGVSLRNIGPSGAGRTLVLWDGVPLNDPFGGWVTWTKLPRLSLGAAEIVRGGGSSAWGSAALGGTVQLLSAPAADQPFLSLRGEIGEASTASGEVWAGASGWSVNARSFTTDGFWRVPASDRGSVDRRTDQDHQFAQVGWSGAVSSRTRASITLRGFQEDRGNGTPLQQNATEELFLSGRLAGTFNDGPEWSLLAYGQTQEFSSGFSSVAPGRESESPALDQYAVPADAGGAAFTTTWREDDQRTTTVGADVRVVEGETREAFFVQNGAFTRRRFAGGRQGFAGVFVQHEQALAPQLRAQIGARVDGWRNDQGHRRELDLAQNTVVREDAIASRDGVEFSPSAGLVWTANEQWRVRGAAYRAFRVPTLNELYRPFRVGNVITEANPELAVETLDGAELTIETRWERASLAATGFINRLENAVANVTLGAGPATIPGVGFVPAGGLGRQRQNLDDVRVQGVELTGRWSASQHVELRADYLYSDATVRRATGAASSLRGRRLAQVPEHTLVLGAQWQFLSAWHLAIQARHVSRAFEDDLNTLTLDAATTVDLGLSYRWPGAPGRELFLNVENLLDETVVAGRDADGRVDLGQPRFVHGGVRWSW